MSRNQRQRRKEEKRKKDPRKRNCAVCGKGAHSGSGYCLDHLPDESRCTHSTRKGRRCRLPIVVGADVCKVHLVTMQRGYGSGKYGWVYLYDTTFRKDGKGIYKIGRSVNVRFREQDLKASNPYGEVLFAGFVGGQAKKIEGGFHQYYQKNWLEKELFELSDAQVNEFYYELKDMSSWWYERGKKEEELPTSVYQGPRKWPWEKQEVSGECK